MDEATIIEALNGLATSTLHEVMDKRNTLWPSIRPLWQPMRLCGPAFTVQGRPSDNLAAHWALTVAPAGSVLVITTEGDTQCAGWGEITTVAALARGLRGLLTDGAVRDTEACRRRGFPIFSQGVSIKGTTKAYPGALNVPIVCAGALVRPGDYIVADEDGVVVVPRDQAETVIQKARQKEAKEAEIMEHLQAGALTVDELGLRSKLP
jgi:4-hydroxy-4-methyl-2-oxoglutarate aldolase